QRLSAAIHELLADGAAGVGRQVLQRGRVGGRRGHDDRVLHGAVFLEGGHDLGDLGVLLANGHVDAEEILALLVDDGVDGDGRLAGLAVADDQLALAAANRDHGVDGFDAGLHRCIYRLPIDDGRRDALDGPGLGRGDGAFAVDRLAERIDDAADHGVPDGHLDDAAGAAHLVPFLNAGLFAQEHGADVLLLEVEVHTPTAVRSFHQLVG